MKEVVIESNVSVTEFLEIVEKERQERLAQPGFFPSAPPLFRGQSNAGWKLSSTLERNVPYASKLNSYKMMVNSTIVPINSSCGTNYKWCDLTDRSRSNPYMDNQELMVNLRQFGFTSPLLDFSINPLVAAYFAFRDAIDGVDVSIYMFERTKRIEGYCLYSEHGPDLHVIPHAIRANSRHSLQASCYLYCVDREENTGFVPFQDFFDGQSDELDNVMTKFIFRGCKRVDILDQLNMLGITEFALFGTDDALVKTIEFHTLYSRYACVIGDGIEILVAKSQR